MKLFTHKLFGRWLVAIALAVLVIALGLQIFGLPAYRYHGEELAVPEFLELVEAGYELNCVQTPPGSLWDRLRLAGTYTCFDTAEEAADFGNSLN
ncbi:MAG: hypothetical protein JXN59_01045 [Anaerolineae bacterium]|nr:hypothetical protein [Anaerolineae bacterium]